MDLTSTPIGEMRSVASGVLVHRLNEGVAITEADAVEVKRITERLAGGSPVVVIVEMQQMAFADRSVLEAFASAGGGVEVATGLVVDRGISEDLAGLFVRFHDPDRPVEVFERLSDAMEWGQSVLAGRA